ncbi:MAG TPA: DUF2934 domain-containing protein [Magnetospirillum sp.]|nr:DUF2934 domain-containing protein [Magnetospirillum sp.]
MDIDENAIRRRAYRIWEAEGRPPEKFEEHMRRARREIEVEFRRATAHVGDVDHRLNPPLQVEEALDPSLPRWTTGERRT